MALKIVDTPFSTQTNDPLSLLDVASRKGKSVAPIGSFGNDNVTAITSTVLSNPSELKSLLERMKRDELLNIVQNLPNSIMKRLSKLLGGDTSILNGLAENALQELLQGLMYDTNNTYYKYNGNKISSPTNQYQQQNDYTSLMQSVVTESTFEVVDNEAEESLYGHLLKETIALNNTDAIIPLLEKISDPTVKERLQKDAVDNSVDSGNIDALAELVTHLGSEKVVQLRPYVVRDIFQNFKIPKNTELTDAQLGSNLAAVTGELEPLWYKYLRGVELIENLTYYMAMSKGAKKVLSTQSIHATNVLLSKGQKIASIPNLQKQFYPYTYFIPAVL